MDPLPDTIAGLPVHPLVIHAVVVLLPLSAVGAVLIVVSRRVARRLGALVVLLAAVATVAAFLARGSGQQLALQVGVPAAHASLGNALPWFAVGFLVPLVVLWLFDRGIPSNRPRPLWLTLVGALVIVGAVLATSWTVRAGHSGAEATWSGVVVGG